MSKKPIAAEQRRQKREAEVLDPDPGLLGELLHTHQALLHGFSRTVGMAPARLHFLHELLHAGADGIGVVELAKRLGVTPALVTRQGQELEREGWVRRRGDPRDGRRRRLVLTAKGLRRGAEIHLRGHQFQAALTAGLDPAEAAAAARVLAALRSNLEAGARALEGPAPRGGRPW